MANCTKCGAELSADNAFCGSCGNRIVEAQNSGAPNAVAAASTGVCGAIASGAVPGATPSSTGLTMNLAAALSYALGAITGVLFLVMEPYKSNRAVRFHALQSIFFNVAWVLFWIVWSMLTGILTSMAGLWLLSVEVPVGWLIGLGIFGYWLFLMFQAYSEREYRIPWIGDLAAKQVK